MSVSRNKYIRRVEKQLVAFQKYSFHNYCELMLILVNTKHFLEGNVAIKGRLIKNELQSELDQRILMLHNMLSDPNKHDNFHMHVESAFHIIEKIDHCLPIIPIENKTRRTSILDVLKRYFTANLRHT